MAISTNDRLPVDTKPSSAVRIWLAVALFAALACRASAGIRPSFLLDHSAWEATDIVIVEVTPEDGLFEVVEAWKGDLQPAQRIALPKLRPGPEAVPISLYPERAYGVPDDASPSTRIPKQPPGSRLVLFLKRASSAESASNKDDQDSLWQPSNLFHDMKTAAVWIDDGKLYSFAQMMNPGPSVLIKLKRHQWDSNSSTWEPPDMTAADLRTRVEHVVRMQQELRTTIQTPDLGARAESLATYARSDIGPARSLAFGELGKVGPSALPVLRAMLDDPEYSKLRDAVMGAYIQAGGVALGEDLSSRLKAELVFWKVTGPSLGRNWWNEDAIAGGPIRQRYTVTLEILRGLKTSRPISALNTAIQLRDLWRSLPQLNDRSGTDRLADECDALVQDLLSK